MARVCVCEGEGREWLGCVCEGEGRGVSEE